jgi:hypothetical protein
LIRFSTTPLPPPSRLRGLQSEPGEVLLAQQRNASRFLGRRQAGPLGVDLALESGVKGCPHLRCLCSRIFL